MAVYERAVKHLTADLCAVVSVAVAVPLSSVGDLTALCEREGRGTDSRLRYQVRKPTIGAMTILRVSMLCLISSLEPKWLRRASVVRAVLYCRCVGPLAYVPLNSG